MLRKLKSTVARVREREEKRGGERQMVETAHSLGER